MTVKPTASVEGAVVTILFSSICKVRSDVIDIPAGDKCGSYE